MIRLIWLLAVVVILSITVSLVLPTKKIVYSQTKAAANAEAVKRHLRDSGSWAEFWPADFMYFDEISYKVNKNLFNGFEILIIMDDEDTLLSYLTALPITLDSTMFTWSCYLDSSRLPWKRLLAFQRHKALKSAFNTLLDRLANYTSNETNLYEMDVKEVKVTDSALISTKRNFDHYPTTSEVYEMVDELKAHIHSKKANITNHPMLNVLRIDSLEYQAMVAIPVDRLLAPHGTFEPKLVLKGGKLLEAEIKGGWWTIQNAVRNFELYVQDYNRSSPAIPYQLMVTNREEELDTSRWITRLHYPVF